MSADFHPLGALSPQLYWGQEVEGELTNLKNLDIIISLQTHSLYNIVYFHFRATPSPFASGMSVVVLLLLRTVHM